MFMKEYKLIESIEKGKILKIGIQDNKLIIIDTRKFSNPEPIKIPIEIVKEIIRKNERRTKSDN